MHLVVREENVKIVHLINQDGLFLAWVKQIFDREGITNEFVVINSKGDNNLNENGDFHCDLSNAGKHFALNIIDKNEIAIHYFLDYTKSELILKSNENVKHFWYFFGADVYQQLNVFRKNLYGAETRKWMRFSFSYRFRLQLRAFKYLFLNGKYTPKQNLLKSIERVNKILWYIEDEINWINTKVKTPEFEFFKFFKFKDVIPFDKGSVDTSLKNILIGNSATIENNHLDVLAAFRRYQINDYSISLPMAYGEPKKYKATVKQEFSDFFGSNFYSQEGKLSLGDYYRWLNGFPTAIMLHYRQQALGNIFYLIANGTKVYLSEKNVLLAWFLKNDVKVFCFEKQFAKDHLEKNVTLELNDRELNYTNLKKLLSQESTFIEQILNDFK